MFWQMCNRSADGEGVLTCLHLLIKLLRSRVASTFFAN